MLEDAYIIGHQSIAALLSILLLGACIASAVPRAARLLAFISLAGAGVAAAVLLGAVIDGGTVRYSIGGWSAPIGIELAADGIGSLMAMTTVLVMLTCLLAPGARKLSPTFWMMWLWSALALVTLFLSIDLFNAYVALELVGLCAVALVAMAGGRTAMVAAARYLLIGLVASAFYLLGVAIVYAQTGALELHAAIGALGATSATGLALGLLSIGLLMKSAAFPFHGWLPSAHANAPAAASAVLSALVIKGAVVLSWRIWDALPSGLVEPIVSVVIGALGLAAIGWGGAQALRATRLKVILAYSTVAQVGFLLLVLAMVAGGNEAALGPGLLLLIVHSFAKASAFCAAGMIILHLGSDRLDQFKGLAARMPMTTIALAMAAVALVGLPPSGSFVAKLELLSLAAADGQWLWVAGIIVGTFLSALYLLRPLSMAFRDMDQHLAIENERGAIVPLLLALAAFVLIFAAGTIFDVVTLSGDAG
ncbi:MAG: multicomponent Na+:H+ antiporter subunit D [Gammaproteobacteria bacterium]|jgi:multicomponent Na+:H+ antiporter subunit D